MGQPPCGQPQYGPPQDGQPQYGQPQYGQTPYGQPQYGHPQFGQTPYGQPQHSQPQFGHPQNAQTPFGATVAGYPGYPGQPGNPYAPQQGGTPPGPQRRTGKGWWIAAGAVAVIVVVMIVAVVLVFTLGGERGKPMPTATAAALLLPQSDFPAAGGTFADSNGESGEKDKTDYSLTVDKPECKRLAYGSSASGDGAARMQTLGDLASGSLASYSASVEKSADPQLTSDLEQLRSTCETFTATVTGFGTSTEVHINVTPLTISGINGSYHAMTITSSADDVQSTLKFASAMVIGVERGVVFIEQYDVFGTSTASTTSSETTGNLATMFNKQRSIIADAH
ncbi:hypothetical protein [Gordonia sputi]|nr:hypothetical protein [Gordonia sputi]NKY93920.1 hypothetical protein [Gordonia sputi]